jgi:metallo-beta-lactamase class B
MKNSPCPLRWAAVSSAAALACSTSAQQLAIPDQQSAEQHSIDQQSADQHIAAATEAAKADYGALFESTCGLVRPPAAALPAAEVPAAPLSAAPPPAPPQPAAAIDPAQRASWHVAPHRVFDNLYFVGQVEFSAWAITTSDGIIVMDALFDYSVDDEIIEGLRSLGLDPAQIRYVVISHAHGDHVGGAKKLQDLGAKIVMSAADWDLLDRSDVNFAKPARDVVASDGQQLTVGDTTLILYVTPGHTLGTVSSIFPSRTAAAHTWLHIGVAPRSTGCGVPPSTSAPNTPRNSGSTAMPRARSGSAIWQREPAPT